MGHGDRHWQGLAESGRDSAREGHSVWPSDPTVESPGLKFTYAGRLVAAGWHWRGNLKSMIRDTAMRPLASDGKDSDASVASLRVGWSGGDIEMEIYYLAPDSVIETRAVATLLPKRTHWQPLSRPGPARPSCYEPPTTEPERRGRGPWRRVRLAIGDVSAARSTPGGSKSRRKQDPTLATRGGVKPEARSVSAVPRSADVCRV